MSAIQNAGFIQSFELRSVSPGGKTNTPRESDKGHFGLFNHLNGCCERVSKPGTLNCVGYILEAIEIVESLPEGRQTYAPKKRQNRSGFPIKAGKLNFWAYVFLIICIVLSFFSATALCEQEEILRFESSLEVRKDSVLVIEERITVRALGKGIKRGIYRDFPTLIRDSWGFRYEVGFNVKEVLRDGEREPFSIEDITGVSIEGSTRGKRVKIGKASVFLEPGIYEYLIRYETFPQVRYFSDYDELYWNVTGNGWDFPIDEAVARVVLPDGISPLQVKDVAYTGKQGAKGKTTSLIA